MAEYKLVEHTVRVLQDGQYFTLTFLRDGKPVNVMGPAKRWDLESDTRDLLDRIYAAVGVERNLFQEVPYSATGAARMDALEAFPQICYAASALISAMGEADSLDTDYEVSEKLAELAKALNKLEIKYEDT